MAVGRVTPILIVDDVMAMVRIVRGLLAAIGYAEADAAGDGDEAFARMQAKRYGLVIADWNLGDTSGLELLKRVRADERLARTPFIMITAEPRAEQVIAAKRAGVSQYLVKPFTARVLKARIDAVFGPVGAAA